MNNELFSSCDSLIVYRSRSWILQKAQLRLSEVDAAVSEYRATLEMCMRNVQSRLTADFVVSRAKLRFIDSYAAIADGGRSSAGAHSAVLAAFTLAEFSKYEEYFKAVADGIRDEPEPVAVIRGLQLHEFARLEQPFDAWSVAEKTRRFAPMPCTTQLQSAATSFDSLFAE